MLIWKAPICVSQICEAPSWRAQTLPTRICGVRIWARVALTDANLDSASLNEANLEQADLVGALSENATIEKANLRRAKLVGANLSGALMRGTNLREAVLAEASLEEVNLLSCDLTHVYLADAWLERTRCSKEQFGSAIGEEVAGDILRAQRKDIWPWKGTSKD